MSEKMWTVNTFKRQFSHENDCLKALLDYRVDEYGKCLNPNCTATVKKYYRKIKTKKAFICIKCLQHFYPMNGSMFSHSHVPLQDFFSIVFAMLYSRNGISANEIHRTFGLSYPTAFRIIHAIRLQMMKCLDSVLFAPGAAIEVDESFVKVGNRGMSRHTYMGRGRGNKTCATVLVICERGGPAKLFPIESASFDNIFKELKDRVEETSLIYTDSWKAYKKLKDKGYKHAFVKHEDKEFVKGSASTNSCESIFGNMKRTFNGTYRNISEGKLINYVNESAFRHTFRYEHDYGWGKLMNSLTPLSQVYYRPQAA